MVRQPHRVSDEVTTAQARVRCKPDGAETGTNQPTNSHLVERSEQRSPPSEFFVSFVVFCSNAFLNRRSRRKRRAAKKGTPLWFGTRFVVRLVSGTAPAAGFPCCWHEEPVAAAISLTPPGSPGSYSVFNESVSELKQLGQYQGAGVLTGLGLRLWHFAHRYRLPFTAVLGRTCFPVRRMFLSIMTTQ